MFFCEITLVDSLVTLWLLFSSNVAEEFRADSPIVAKVDCSDSKDLKEQYKIDSYPTVMCFLRGQEQPIKYLVLLHL